MKRMFWLLAAFPFALGCASEHMGDGTDRSMASELVQAEQELQRHHRVVMHASDTFQLIAETTAHDERMRGLIDEMHASVSDDMHCSHAGEDQMESTMATMDHAQGEHLGRPHTGRSLEALQAACTAYVAQMHAALEDMQHALGGTSCIQ